MRILHSSAAAHVGRTRRRTVSKNLDAGADADSDLAKQGEEVEWNSKGILAHHAGRVGARRVEVAEQGAVPGGIRVAVVLDDCTLLDCAIQAVLRITHPAQSSSWCVRRGLWGRSGNVRGSGSCPCAGWHRRRR